MKKALTLIASIVYVSFFAQPGKDGAYTVSTNNQVLNKYCPVAANIAAGSSSISLSTGPGFSLCPGDLIMVYQAQGATISFANSISYGNITSFNSAGFYEFKYVQSVNGNVVTVQTTFTNSYATAGRVQVIKVPQYTTLNINAGTSVVAKAWKDTTILAVPYRFGGLVVIHASNINNNGTISSSGSGFRGGALVNSPYITNIVSYVTANTGEGAEKGEGVFGYQTDYDGNGGRLGRGAAGNAGGGGNGTNSPGGGGANGNNGNVWSGQGVMIVNPNNPLAAWALDPGYIANGNALTNSSGGGRGGYCWASVNLNALTTAPGNPSWGGDSRREAGGLGGRPLTNINADTRIYFGGGGGAGHENNSAGSAGGNGGGIVYLIATSGITGTGTIVANGNTAANTQGCHCDGVGGGGAGGSIIIKSTAVAVSQNILATGGNGGNQLIVSTESEGPGGGGGGGFGAVSAGPAPNVNGGFNGTTTSAAVTEMTYNGSTQGALGQATTVSTNFIPFTPIPLPVTSAPTTTQSTCTNSLNAFNLGLIFNPPNPAYTINWSTIPNGVLSNTQSSGTGGINPGVYTATILTGGSCAVPVVTSFTINPAPAPLNFSVNPSYSITCAQSTVFVSLNGANSYTWTNGISAPQTGSLGIFTPNEAVGTWSVTGVSPSGCSNTQTFSIVQNTFAPTNSVNPTSQAITCNSGSPVTFSGTVTNLTVNVQHDWYSPLSPLPGGPPISTSNNTITILSGNIPPGVYTLVTTNLVNGCTAQKTVTITSLSAWPTFNIASTTNFSVGCSPINCTTLNIVNPQSTQSPPGVCSYTFLAPSFTGAVTPSVVLGGNTSTVFCTPGTWTVIVQDNSNFCRTMLTVPIIQNTVAPNVSASMFTQTLTCKNPTVIGTGTTTTPNTVISWNLPTNPPNLSTHTVLIGTPPNGPNTSTTSLNYSTFTVIATNSVNACQSSSVVTIYQNFRPPVSSPTISIGTPTAIYCTAATQPVVLTTGNSTVTSGGFPSFVANPSWQGPAPQTISNGPSSYSCYVPGIYTLTIEDSYNGCTRSGTINVVDKTQPPVPLNPSSSATLDCGTNQAILFSAINGPSTGLMYWYFYYPPGTAFSPTSASIPNGGNPYLSGTPSQSVYVSKGGRYEYIVSNTLTGCQATGTFVVEQGELTAGFDADKVSGYSPLVVIFTNNSLSSLSSSSITSIWSFGNGTSQTTTANINTTTTYTAPGTYTVWLIAAKGLCNDTTYKIITVDMPSKMEVPNVFTPNGDGTNDVFFLKVANISDVHALIFDRWGNKVYEVNSSTGNIAWDGKNFEGKECAAGVYFYIVNATGKDDKGYEAKGNVSLFR